MESWIRTNTILVIYSNLAIDLLVCPRNSAKQKKTRHILDPNLNFEMGSIMLLYFPGLRVRLIADARERSDAIPEAARLHPTPGHGTPAGHVVHCRPKFQGHDQCNLR